MCETRNGEAASKWFVMRDLSHYNSRQAAWEVLKAKEIEYFTPMVWKISTARGKTERKRVPFLRDLVFVHSTRETTDNLVQEINKFQYRFLRFKWNEPMTVRDEEMERFIRAVEATDSPRYYTPEEITEEMRRRPIRIIGGNLDGCEGTLVTVRGSKQKRLLVEIPQFLAATVTIEDASYIQLQS